jgi:hypothetical protein
MSEEKKILSEEELNQVKAFRAQENQIMFALGKNRIEKENLLASYRAVVTQEQDLHSKLSIKYGDGSIDLSTGEIAPFENA